MIDLTHSAHAQAVQRMFAGIAVRYDLMNRLMSAGQDLRWRRLAVQAANLQTGDRLLDIAAGTGDMVFIAQAMVPNLKVAAADFAVEMMRVGRQRSDGLAQAARPAPPAHWTGADTYALPFSSQSFDAVTSAFLLRNLADPLTGLIEQARVLKPGGQLVMLDATPAPDNWLKPFIDLHLSFVIPTLGGLIAGRADAYRYFPNSIANFLRPEAIAGLFQKAGLKCVTYRSFMLDTAALVVGTKPDNGK